MAITSDIQTAVGIHSKTQRDINQRIKGTKALRAAAFQSKEVFAELIRLQGTEASKQGLLSLNAVADSNQLEYINALNGAEITSLAVGFGTLRATRPVPSDMSIAEIMIESLYWSAALNNLSTSTYSDEPKWHLIYKADGTADVGDLNPDYPGNIDEVSTEEPAADI